ncbi:unnamed protein product [Didymodactylos carnosus]|uniref:Glycosyltransferase 2-like domain-containing protein n=1 Tax=Didymodactylos carnosus TaxID=1234261 RepID=A0A8S2TUZ1_9BILA|nr:unnamed protein product [Didymodactylos carnosus]CAF4310167.1 unnamed protein product [Didymodactylos carnosus]
MILIPIYKEDPLIIENTLKSLIEQNVSMIIGFALEERDINSNIKYNYLINKYENFFIKIIKTIHPNHLINEISGKGSNCNYCVQILAKYYENDEIINLKNKYSNVMITVCDCDTIWCKNYFLYLNYLCTINNIKNFNHIVYTPNITNLKTFQSNHILINCMSMVRTVYTHGHFRCLGYIRGFTSEYHIPLKLLKLIDYWDNDLVHEDIHMYNKLAILNDNLLVFKHTLLPCDNQTPTNINSCYQSLKLLWYQSLRWNLFIYDLYYLFHQLYLNIFNIKRYENFQTNSYKIILQIINNYENLFFLFISPISNNLFWIFYLYMFNSYADNDIVYYLLNYIQSCFLIIQILLGIFFSLFCFNTNDENTKGEQYHGKISSVFLLGLIIMPFFATIYQGMNVIVAWIQTLKDINTHSESASKTVSNSKTNEM